MGTVTSGGIYLHRQPAAVKTCTVAAPTHKPSPFLSSAQAKSQGGLPRKSTHSHKRFVIQLERVRLQTRSPSLVSIAPERLWQRWHAGTGTCLVEHMQVTVTRCPHLITFSLRSRDTGDVGTHFRGLQRCSQ